MLKEVLILNGKLNTAVEMLKKNRSQIPYAVFRNLTHKGLTRWIPDKAYIKIAYRLCIGKKLNLDNPKTFNEKLQWLKLYDRNPQYIEKVDKYRVRGYIKEVIGEEYLIPLLGVWDSFEDINFDILPEKFVLKCNHDSGSVIICKDKNSFNIGVAREKLEKALKSTGYWFGREWPYKDVKPCIICEKYMEDTDGEISDYKFYCFNGIPLYCQVIANRSSNETIDFYDMNWKWMNFTGNQYPFKPHAKDKRIMPYTFEEMKKLATILADGMSFARIDFYCINRKTYFGEITFYPAGGFGKFEPADWNEKFGALINIESFCEKDNI